MTHMILQPTEMAQWHELIKEAKIACFSEVDEELESYLVFLLMRFVQHPEFAASIVALEYLQGIATAGKSQQQKLQEVGDKCLLLAGLFPGRAERRRVHIGYFVEVGRRAYASVAAHSKQSLAGLYHMLCYKFIALMDILLTTRELTYKIAGLTPLQAAELWSDTHSYRALENLRQYTQATLVESANNLSGRKN